LISDKKKKPFKLKGIIKYILSLGLSVFFLYIAFHNVNFDKVLQYVSHASIFWIIIFITFLMFAHLLRAIRWKIILSSVKKDTSLLNLFGALMVGYGVNDVVPRLGEITRAVLLGKWEGVSRTAMFGTVIVERVIDVIFLGLTVFTSVLIWSESLYDKFTWLKDTLYITSFMIVLMLLFLYFTIKFKKNFYMFLIKFVGYFSEKTAHKAAYIFDMLTVGFSSLRGLKNYSLVIFLSTAIMVTYALTSYFGFFTLGMENIKHVTFTMGWVLMSISAIGVVIPTPGGTGSYHVLTKAALVLLFGFGDTISLAYAFLTHIISYMIFIIAGLFFFFLLNKQHDNLIKIVETELEEL